MVFNSLGYLAFLLVAVALHWVLPHRFRVYFLCAVSVAFYSMWRWEFSALVVFSAVVDYVCASRIARSDRPGVRRGWLLVSLCVNLGLLLFFKYTYFIVDSAFALTAVPTRAETALADWGLRIVLPLGISFYTFQTISYTIDVYRGVVEPLGDFPTFLAYVMFWPQLIAGPVLRAGEVVPLISARRRFSWTHLEAGGWRVLLGLFKKVVVADGIAHMVEYWFDQPTHQLTAVDVWVAAFLFGIQIYCDFGGYSDMAIGSARMVGIQFPQNFNWPYASVSPRDFWQRWHISMSSWIRDYLYLPLTGQRFRCRSTGGMAVAGDEQHGERRRYAALALTWLLMGLWHGAAWKFVVWGLYHGAFVLLYRVVPPLRKLPQRTPVLAALIMLPIAMAGWIPFRAQDLSQCFTMFGTLLNPAAYRLSTAVTGLSSRTAGYSYLAALGLPVALTGLWLCWRRIEDGQTPAWLEAPGRLLLAAGCTTAILISLSTKDVFIYFQF